MYIDYYKTYSNKFFFFFCMIGSLLIYEQFTVKLFLKSITYPSLIFALQLCTVQYVNTWCRVGS